MTLSYYINVWSILLPVLISLIRFRKISSVFYPFLLILWLGCINEATAHFLLKKGYTNAIPSNVFSLLEACFIIWLFYRAGAPRNIKKICLPLLLVFLTAWLVENIFVGKFGPYFNSYFNILSGFAIVLLSINIVNELLVKERELLKNPLFILCIAFIVYFTYRLLVETFWVSGQYISEDFMTKVFVIHTWVNLVCNIIFAVAILWMQKRQAFTLQYS